MSDKPAESAVGAPETLKAPPTPSFSAVSTPATPSQSGFNEDALVEKLIGRLAPEIDKRFQSAKDKRLSAIDRLGGVEDLVKLKEYLKAKPTDPDGAIRDFQLDQLLAERGQAAAQPAVTPEVPGRTQPADPTSDVQAWTTDILTEAGVDWGKDADYQALAAKPYASPEQFKTAVTKFVAKRARQAIQPGAATNLGTGAGGAPAQPPSTKDEKRDQTTTRLNELLKKPVQNAKEIAKLQGELRAAMVG